jgi:hypothetical protein
MSTPTVFKNVKVELSADNSSWTDVSIDANMLTVDGFDLETEGTPVFGQGKRLQTVGNWELGTITVRALYAESTSAAWGLANTAFEGRSALYVRWSPKGGSTGNYRFTSDAGYIKQPVWAGGEANASPIMPEIVLETPWITQSTIA